ncbi:hypothetical protein [Anaerococcus sp. Marseille-Q7828]|uniref:hypothetical protein n=1 Tax=Anaerococcus sp. Marseille-Q7828 TaxID=3036300 RepID=UPI0024AD599A|nr:hypothetical protein [Anaerococcus sp. Marseille-Q7828]
MKLKTGKKIVILNLLLASQVVFMPCSFAGEKSHSRTEYQTTFTQNMHLASNNIEIGTLAVDGTKWAEGKVEYIGQGSHLVTNYFWVKGSDMPKYNVVGRARRKAVIDKYGSINENATYKMKTTQKVNMSMQTQGIVTVSAKAWCYGIDLKTY